MRFLSCKIHCPSFICFCKSSPHIYSPGPLKLENIPHVLSEPASVHEDSDQLSGEAIEVKEDCLYLKQQQPADHHCLKSSIRKPILAAKEDRKKKVQWVDFLGKELVEIREFESSEIEYTDNEGDDNRGCVCVIL
ncbi:hypothetical protein F2P56_033541 [Juglans regia]|uniref:Uncharacterized protein LOC109003582 n=2 Tax=Juglans regia TaxID=51240 RepID=A0A2I4G0A8_JUGRE|nr:uncharacterized protein LOC109003582 [Juglans regia]XP_018837338.1 uncharacterized protein LOC109003582 [Juglans regia]XP_018837347.1 uncharacterized protein LOC109003582 [Juglans regia]XP_018837355.1 uncharacterized protein LOC109003582 [Juglans regia]XP_035541119.1 uncharacterized protein LOC109003582 [Juglans regia]XP_035541120.1 uncharacterized protein LOC109003582 [Juglans regia]KAF5448036.1 hypothetical protein F2P56_033541 [Juglans regia]